MTTTDVEPDLADAGEVEARPGAPTGLPAGTTTLFVLLIASVLATTSTVFFTLNYAVSIRWPAEVWMALGIGLVFGLAGVHYWLHPWWIERRGGLREMTLKNSRQLVEELHELCALAGVRPPRFMLAPYGTKSSEGLAFGRARERAVKLDMRLVASRVHNPEGFRAVVLHELAHLRNRDVDLTYFTVAIWRSFVAVSVPLMVWLSVRSAWTQTSAGWPTVALVAASLVVLTLLVYLTRNALLRSRELHADARVAEWDDAGAGSALRSVLEQEAMSAPPDDPVHRLRDDHPHPARRLEALANPESLSRPSLWELFAVGVVAAILLSNGFVFFTQVLEQYRNLGMFVLIVPVVTGTTGALVLAAVRTAVLSGGRPSARLLALPLALVCGYLVGEATSLVNTASGKWVMFGRWDRDLPEATTVVTAAGSLVVGAVLVTVWAKSAASTLVVRGRVHRATVYGLTAAAAAATMPWLLIWWLLRSDVTGSVNAALNRDERVPAPIPDALPDGYAAVVAWVHRVVSWPADSLFLMASRYVPGVLVGVVLLWSVPLLLARRKPVNPHAAEVRCDIRRTLLLAAVGSASCVAVFVTHVLVIKSAYNPLEHRDELETWARSTLAVLNAGAVLIQVLTAVGVVVSTRRLRPVLALMAVTIVAATAAVVHWVGVQPGNCFAMVEIMVEGCWRTTSAESVASSWHYSVEFGIATAAPAAALAAGVLALVRSPRPVPPDVLPGGGGGSTRWWPGAVGASASVALLAAAAFAGADRWEIFSRESSGDRCLVGTWTEVSSTHDLVLEDIVIRMERSGTVRSFHPDGTGALDFGDGVVETGTYNDHSLTDAYSGKIEYRYEVDDGAVHLDITAVDITRRREVDGTLIGEKSLNSFTDTTAEDSFTCSADRLVLEGETTSEYTRLNGS